MLVKQDQPVSQVEIAQLKPLDRFPSCVSIRLHSTPVPHEESSRSVLISTTPQQPVVLETDLSLTIRFGEQEIKVPGGQVWFGLKRGQLRLKLENGRIPLEKVALIAPLELAIEVEDQQESGASGELNLSLTGVFQPDPAAMGSGVGVKGGFTSKKGTKVKHKVHQCINGGTEVEPNWIFESKVEEQILVGQRTQEKLGTVEISTNPCQVKATFEVSGQVDIRLTRASGLWVSDIGRNKAALIERLFFLRFIAPKLQPYLSQVEVQL